MAIDLEWLLVIGTLVTGIVWLLDVVWWRKVRMPAPEGAAEVQEPWYVDYSRAFFPVLLLVLLLRSFVFEPFRIPSGSMMPTLLVGDFIWVNKYDYGLRLPITSTKILKIGEPHRGDVVVFRFPRDPNTDYIKRIVGLPGDVVTYVHKTLYINGKKMTQTPVGPYADAADNGEGVDSTEYVENLGGVKHDILLMPSRPSLSGEWIVPPHHYFVMGDNRDNSNDSRYWGTVPEQNLVGKAEFIWFNWNIRDWTMKFSRIGDIIH
ncbi:MAG: signal peptidase I [Gammaproteobacteria bacterium]|jgi:signal peptidase I